MFHLATVGDLLEQLPCLKPRQHPEIFGPTDINAQTGNQSLSVAFNGDGTVTVLRWPSPSFYDQVKYHTSDRDEPRFGALPNEGAFLGLRVETDEGERLHWLRDWETDQRYAEGLTDEVVTVHRGDDLGLAVTVRDLVAPDADVLRRRVEVERDPDSPVIAASLVAFENFNLVVTKEARNPVRDWCREGQNTDAAAYDAAVDAVVHARDGVDRSTGDPRRVAVGLALGAESDAHQVGGDAHEPAARATDERERDAFEDAREAPLTGNHAYEGQTTGAMEASLSFESGTATETVFVAADATRAAVAERVEAARERSFAAVSEAKREWFEARLGDAPMPDTDDEAVLKLCRTALVTLVTNFDPRSGAVVASVATQSPYSLDWPRDGAYFNMALQLLGLEDHVATRNRWYAELQRHAGTDAIGDADPPAGAWAMNFYADGVVGGPIPWEIDETGYAAWTLVDHYDVTGDEEYLRDVYPAVRRTADLLCEFRDGSGLPERAHEDDNAIRSQSIVGAGPAWLALDAAERAARVVGEEVDADRYAERKAELGAAIDAELWNEADGAYNNARPNLRRLQSLPVVGDVVRGLPITPSAFASPAVAWPVGFADLDHPRMERHLQHVWDHLADTFRVPEAGDRKAGLYEAHGLVSLAQAWRDDPERLARVRHGVEWVAREHATDDTHVMGEVWMEHEGEVVTTVSQPHTWGQVLFYFASLEAFPPVDLPDGERSVVDYLRGRGPD